MSQTVAKNTIAVSKNTLEVGMELKLLRIVEKVNKNGMPADVVYLQKPDKFVVRMSMRQYSHSCTNENRLWEIVGEDKNVELYDVIKVVSKILRTNKDGSKVYKASAYQEFGSWVERGEMPTTVEKRLATLRTDIDLEEYVRYDFVFEPIKTV